MNILASLIDPVLDKIFPDKDKLLEAKQKLAELNQAGELAFLDADVKIALGQAAINEHDAQSSSKLQSWWRPAAGWVCVFGLIYPVGTALLSWGLQVSAWALETDLSKFPIPPQIDTGYLITMLMGMLGLGAQRTYERHQRHTKWNK